MYDLLCTFRWCKVFHTTNQPTGVIVCWPPPRLKSRAIKSYRRLPNQSYSSLIRAAPSTCPSQTALPRPTSAAVIRPPTIVRFVYLSMHLYTSQHHVSAARLGMCVRQCWANTFRHGMYRVPIREYRLHVACLQHSRLTVLSIPVNL